MNAYICTNGEVLCSTSEQRSCRLPIMTHCRSEARHRSDSASLNEPTRQTAAINLDLIKNGSSFKPSNAPMPFHIPGTEIKWDFCETTLCQAKNIVKECKKRELEEHCVTSEVGEQNLIKYAKQWLKEVKMLTKSSNSRKSRRSCFS